MIRVKGLVVIHGLPEEHTAPSLQLASAESAFASLTPVVLRFEWGKECGFPSIYKLLRHGQFANELAPKFNRWLEEQTRNFEEEDRLVVVAYCLGGLIFYGWAVHPETKEKTKRSLALAVTIASPYQCLLEGVTMEKRDGTIQRLTKIKVPRIEPLQIWRNLPDGILRVLLAEKDNTVLPQDSAFIVLPKETHRGVRDADGTHSLIQHFCQSLSCCL